MTKTFHFTGHELIGAHVTEKLEALGYERVEAIGQADVAFTYCVGTSMLEDAYFDDDGLVKNAGAGTMLIDLSPSTPSFTRELSAVATVNDLVFVEAPLAVDDPFSGLNFTCFAACEQPEGLESALPLLEAFASPVEQMGDVGSAQLAKAMHTVSATARIVGEVEGWALAHAMRQTVPLEGDAGDAGEGGFTGGYPVELLMADVVAAMSAADDVDLILPQLEAAMHLLELLVVIGGADMSPKALALLYREEAASAEHGLDWSRAESLFAEHVHDHAHGHAHGDDYDEYGFEDDFGYPGGFGGYSAN